MLRYLVMLAIAASATAEDVDWSQTAEEAARTLQEYIRFDTTVPGGSGLSSAQETAKQRAALIAKTLFTSLICLMIEA